jgi:hypothetical protein
MLDALLHADGARNGIRRRVEHHHQAVPEVLDLLTAGRGDGLPEQTEVAAAVVLGRVLAQTLRDLGGRDEVREQQRDNA